MVFPSSLGKEGVESSFLEYTKEWVKLVKNRGGLFHKNDAVFCFFVEIEKTLARPLQVKLHNTDK